MQPKVDCILETGWYVADLTRAKAFYVGLFGFEVMLDSPRLVALDVAGKSVLLLFARGETESAIDLPGGRVPGHGASGVQHLAFAISEDSVPAWMEKLRAMNVAVESVVRWDGGSQSIYFRDPDDHSVELVTPGLWTNY